MREKEKGFRSQKWFDTEYADVLDIGYVNLEL